MKTAVFLYVLFEMSAAGSVYKWRIPQKDWATCLKNLKETKAAFPNKTSENELGVVVTCGGDKIERFYGSKWYSDEAVKSAN